MRLLLAWVDLTPPPIPPGPCRCRSPIRELKTQLLINAPRISHWRVAVNASFAGENLNDLGNRSFALSLAGAGALNFKRKSVDLIGSLFRWLQTGRKGLGKTTRGCLTFVSFVTAAPVPLEMRLKGECPS